jgi:hypothetical protein
MMRRLQTKFYSVAPLVLLPLMKFNFDEIPEWFRGTQFRGFVSDFLSQVAASIVDAVIIALVNNIYGL